MEASYLLFFFAGLGAFNGLALASWLLWRQPASPAQHWLAALVVMLSVRTGKSVLFYFWPDIGKLVLQIGLSACFLIGPCLIGFVRACLDPSGERSGRDRWVGYGLLGLVLAFGLLFPYSVHTALWQGPIWRSIQYFWLLCLLLSAAFLLRQRPGASALDAQPDAVTGAPPLAFGPGFAAAVTAAVTLVWAAYFWSGWTSYISGALSFTVLVCLSMALAVFRRPAAPRPAQAVEPYQQRKIAPAEAEAELAALHRLMAEEQLYRDPGLSLNKLARRLSMPPARLSQLLNDNHDISFRQYLNQLRIDAAKQLLSESRALPMEQVAEASGFLSMSTFYSSFKKVEGATPAAWRQAQQPGGSS